MSSSNKLLLPSWSTIGKWEVDEVSFTAVAADAEKPIVPLPVLVKTWLLFWPSGLEGNVKPLAVRLPVTVVLPVSVDIPSTFILPANLIVSPESTPTTISSSLVPEADSNAASPVLKS